MPYIPSAHTCLEQDLQQSKSYRSRHHPMSSAKDIATAKESIYHWQQAMPGIKISQLENEERLQLEHVSVIKAHSGIQSTEDTLQSSQKQSRGHIEIPFDLSDTDPSS